MAARLELLPLREPVFSGEALHCFVVVLLRRRRLELPLWSVHGPSVVRRALEGLAEKVEDLLQGVLALSGSAGKVEEEGRARVEDVALALKGVGCAAGDGVGFADGDLLALVGEDAGAAQPAANRASASEKRGVEQAGRLVPPGNC